jgi:hypothetical protein
VALADALLGMVNINFLLLLSVSMLEWSLLFPQNLIKHPRQVNSILLESIHSGGLLATKVLLCLCEDMRLELWRQLHACQQFSLCATSWAGSVLVIKRTVLLEQ